MKYSPEREREIQRSIKFMVAQSTPPEHSLQETNVKGRWYCAVHKQFESVVTVFKPRAEAVRYPRTKANRIIRKLQRQVERISEKQFEVYYKRWCREKQLRPGKDSLEILMRELSA